MAIEDIISEEITTQDPNMQIAQGSPDDFMSEDEMDPYQDPEFQQLLDSMPPEQAQALMQLIKEYKEMVAKGFQGEFEDFVKVKMATAEGDDVNEFQSEEEMIIEPDEMMDIEKQIVLTEMAAEGGIIDPPKMGNPPVIEEIEDMREWRIANPDVEDVADYKGYYDRLKNPEDYDERGWKKKRKKKQEGGIMDVVEDEEMVETTPGPTRQQMIMDYLRDRGLPITPENIQKAIIEMITGGMPYTEEAAYDMPQMDRPSVLPKGMMVDEAMMQQTPSGIATLTEDVMTSPDKSYIYDAPPLPLPGDEKLFKKPIYAAEGGRAGFQEGGPVSDEEEYEQYKSEKEAAGEEYMDFDTYKLFKIQFPMAAGGRVPYGLGSLVKKIFKPIKKVGSKLVDSVKKVVKSPLGKAALMYAATAGASSLGAGKGMGSLFKLGTYNPMTVGSNIGSSYANLKNMFTPAAKTTDSSLLSDVLKQSLAADDKKALVKAGYDLSNLGPSQPTGLMAMAGKALKNPMVTIPAAMLAGGAYTAANPGEENLDRVMADRNKEVANWDNIMANIRSGEMVTPFTTGNVMFPYPNYYQNVAEGGRISRAKGGIMDLGGMEKDYRETGGFVPIGEYEKKDDVPARLSLNEFVMTADAVRGAGNGDIDKGAEVMEDMMETLEQQGQRHRQAQDMFSVSERLSEVVN